MLRDEIESIVYTEEQIANRVKELGKEISERFANQELIIIGALKGCFIFAADLVRQIHCEHLIDFISLSSYGNKTYSVPGAVRVLLDMKVDVYEKHVLIVEDIIDSGYTLQFLQNLIKSRGALSVTSCVFLRKKERLRIQCLGDNDLVGFDIPDEFVVGK